MGRPTAAPQTRPEKRCPLRVSRLPCLARSCATTALSKRGCSVAYSAPADGRRILSKWAAASPKPQAAPVQRWDVLSWQYTTTTLCRGRAGMVGGQNRTAAALYSCQRHLQQAQACKRRRSRHPGACTRMMYPVQTSYAFRPHWASAGKPCAPCRSHASATHWVTAANAHSRTQGRASCVHAISRSMRSVLKTLAFYLLSCQARSQRRSNRLPSLPRGWPNLTCITEHELNGPCP